MKNTITENKIKAIVNLEWAFFDQVQNIGGRADCQDDFRTFSIMRNSQFLCWGNEPLESYYRDLLMYQQEHGNPISLKYAYMMKYTSPAEYAELESKLPSISDKCELLIQEIVNIQTAWSEELYSSYPLLKRRARPIHASDDSIIGVSSETYLRCELYTYSEQTLRLYYDYLQLLRNEGKNIVKMILECTVGFYGYSSLDDAETNMA